MLWIAGAASCYLSLVSVPCGPALWWQIWPPNVCRVSRVHSRTSTDKCKRANTHTHAHTQTHTLAESHTTLSIWLNCISSTKLFFFYTLLNHTRESRLNFRKRITSRLPRAVDSIHGNLFLHICLSVLLCRAWRPYFVNIKQTNVAYFNNIFIRLHIICRSAGGSLACELSAAQHDMNPISNTFSCEIFLFFLN